MASEEKSFENVDGLTTNGRRKHAYTSSPINLIGLNEVKKNNNKKTRSSCDKHIFLCVNFSFVRANLMLRLPLQLIKNRN